ncbi:MAG: zinc-dependent metalloprotease [Microbacteriaceae bacterium]|nr:zinc-dependent metalloprotease [Microbacteriaceae bacterium]
MNEHDDPRRDGDGDEGRPEDELRRILEQLLGGGMIDPDKLAGVAGLPADPAMLAQMMQQMQRAMSQPAGDEVDWDLVRDSARRASPENREVDENERAQYGQAFNVAGLWLGEATAVGDLREAPRAITRHEWISLTLPVWREMCDPVATSISNALMGMLDQQAPEELREMLSRSTPMVRSMGRAMFAMQMGQTLGRLANDVLAGGDIGMPVLPHGAAALVPQNVAAWAEGLELDFGEVVLWFAVRELAHAHLFQHAKWLRLHLETSIAEFAAGITIDASRIEDAVRELDLHSPDELREVLASGRLIPPRTPEQELALERLETMLALIEGWVDVVTADATTRLPNSARIAEMVRRRRATGSPAERAFGSLVGLEIRPRRLREAAAMWREVTERLGAEARDSLWDHRDAVPGAADIDDPSALVDRLADGGEERVLDELDSDLQRLLDDPDSFGDAPSGGEVPGAGPDAGPEGDGPGAGPEPDPDGGPAPQR